MSTATPPTLEEIKAAIDGQGKDKGYTAHEIHERGDNVHVVLNVATERLKGHKRPTEIMVAMFAQGESLNDLLKVIEHAVAIGPEGINPDSPQWVPDERK